MALPEWSPPIGGLPVHVLQNLTGRKEAIKTDDKLFVSPAMHYLMKHASPDELQELLKHIGLIDLDPISITKAEGE